MDQDPLHNTNDFICSAIFQIQNLSFFQIAIPRLFQTVMRNFVWMYFGLLGFGYLDCDCPDFGCLGDFDCYFDYFVFGYLAFCFLLGIKVMCIYFAIDVP